MEEYTPKHSDTPIDQNAKKPNKIIYYVIISIATALLLASVIALCVKFFGGKERFDGYKNNSVNSTLSTVLPANPIDFKAIQSEHEDVVAWIQIPGIDIIDYPIVQSKPDVDDNFYLNHNLSGAQSQPGAIYIQKLNNKDFSDPNTLIYGHNQLNGTMFGQLKKFRNKDFFNENRTIYIYTPDHILEYEIISAFVYDDRHILNSFNFNLETSRLQFFDECINPVHLTKQVVEDASLDVDDKIITLSTCTSRDSERYLVVGKLVKETETQYSGITLEESSDNSELSSAN